MTFISSLPWQAMLVTDLTGDQRPDVVVTDNGGVFFSILFNNGTGQLKDVRSLNLPGVTAAGVLFGSPASVAQADFNGDGLGDLAVLTSKSGQYAVKVFAGTGKSNAPFRVGPSTALATPGTFEPFSMVAGDFNGDGKVDLAIGYSNLLFTSSVVHVYLGNGDGTFTAGSKFSVSITGLQMIAADFNGDGKLDLASSSGFLALGNGDGTFQNPTVFYTISPLDETLGTWLGAADFNHDGKLDLAFQTPEDVSNGQPLLIFLGNGDGTFRNPVSYTWGFLPAWGAIADLNRDGNPDVVILSAEHPHDQIAVFLGNADGSFQMPSFVQLPFAVYPTSIVATDLNGDGKVDLAVMDDGGNALYLFAGNGDGTFGSGVEFGAASTLLWLGFGNYQGQTLPGFPVLVTFDGALNTFFTPSSTAGVAVSTLLNTGQK